MAAFFPGAGRPETLTPTQREMYLSQLGQVLFLRDRAQLLYHFGKVSDEGVAEMLRPDDGPPTPQQANRLRAWTKFTRQYGLGGGIEPDAAREFLTALDQGEVPAWALNIAPLDEIREAAGEGSE